MASFLFGHISGLLIGAIAVYSVMRRKEPREPVNLDWTEDVL